MEHSRSLKLPTTFALLFFTALIGVSSVSASTLKMSVFDGYASSRAVLSGEYEKAIVLATLGIKSKRSYKRTVEATTLCVAHTKSGMLETAKAYCELAVEYATEPMTLRIAAETYTDGISEPLSIVKVTEHNQKAFLALATTHQRTASIN